MIYDCFTFYNELDILEIRLEELYPVVDRFLIVEGSLTFQGNPKPAMGWENSERFEKYADKISWCHVTHGWPVGKNVSAWEREFHQRNMIKNFLQYNDMNDNDRIIISDVDEIPRREIIEIYGNFTVPTEFKVDAYFYYLNARAGYQHSVKMVPWRVLKDTTPQEVRKSDKVNARIGNAGWHFSFVGDTNFIINKMQSFSHTEFNTPELVNAESIERSVKGLKPVWGFDEQFRIVEVDNTWPHAVVENRERWDKYIWQPA